MRYVSDWDWDCVCIYSKLFVEYCINAVCRAARSTHNNNAECSCSYYGSRSSPCPVCIGIKIVNCVYLCEFNGVLFGSRTAKQSSQLGPKSSSYFPCISFTQQHVHFSLQMAFRFHCIFICLSFSYFFFFFFFDLKFYLLPIYFICIYKHIYKIRTE